MNRSTAYGERNQLTEAIADLDAALAADPRHAMAHNNRGFLRMRLGDEAGALTDFANAIRFGPELALPLANRALLYRKRGDDALAEADEAEAERVRERYGPTYRGRPSNPRPDGEVPAIAMPAAPPGR